MEIHPNIKLLYSSPIQIETIYCAAKQCYSSEFIYDEIENNNVSKADMVKLIQKIIKSGHTSILEHVNYTFAIDGISRACTHQLVRHRIASYSQQSQRYCDMTENNKKFEYIIPKSIKNNSKALTMYTELMNHIDTKYNDLKDVLSEDLKTNEQVNQDARYILPNACGSKIVVSMNIRALFNFFELRCCNRAQWEIRYVANEMLKLCKEKCPSIFEKSGAKCKALGYCPEGKFTCGDHPILVK